MLNTKDNRNIALIGFSATGKSEVAKKVAGYLSWNVIDIDDEIVALSGKAINEIFEQEGEAEFRQLERQILEQACKKERVVIATGGGVITKPENRQLLIESSIVICLEAKVDTIYQRLLQDSLYSTNPVIRPLLAGDNPIIRIDELKSSRQSYYAFANWTIHTDNLSLDEVSQEVIKGWYYTNRQHRHEETIGRDDFACMVETASQHYPVFIGWGLLGKLGEKMKQAGLSGKAIIISDELVFSIYGKQSKKIIEEAGFEVNYCIVPPGEATKNIGEAIKIYDFLIKNHVERNDVIVALGGGMVGDLAGFVAATYLRGIRWVQVPTSLIGMADASIGGKVAVDHPQGKNLIGSFYQPCFVLSDAKVLTSLPKREYTSGWAEVIKHGLILDADFFQFLERNVKKLNNLEPDITLKALSWSSCIKAQVVAGDERESGKRIILNYGHTTAHGLETTTNYEYFSHGEAVAIGMMVAAGISQRLGLLSQDSVKRQQTLIEKFNLPITYSGVDLNNVIAAMKLDKKTRGKVIQWVLLEDIGKAVIRKDVSKDDVFNALKGVLKP